MSDIYDQLIQEYLFMFESTDVPLVNIPKDVLPRLIHLEKTFFSTDVAVDSLIQIDSIESLEHFFTPLEERGKMQRLEMSEENNSTTEDSTEDLTAVNDADTIYFFATGISGYGVQNWFFQYFLSTPTLRMSVNLPYGNAYSDAEEEREHLETAVKLITFCQDHMFSAQDKKLTCVLNKNSFVFNVCTANGELLQQGQDIEEMLDYLIKNEDTQSLSHRDWVAV